jgi:hypothetical protein
MNVSMLGRPLPPNGRLLVYPSAFTCRFSFSSALLFWFWFHVCAPCSLLFVIVDSYFATPHGVAQAQLTPVNMLRFAIQLTINIPLSTKEHSDLHLLWRYSVPTHNALAACKIIDLHLHATSQDFYPRPQTEEMSRASPEHNQFLTYNKNEEDVR